MDDLSIYPEDILVTDEENVLSILRNKFIIPVFLAVSVFIKVQAVKLCYFTLKCNPLVFKIKKVYKRLQTKVIISQPNKIWIVFYVCPVERKTFDCINCLTFKTIYYERN